MFQSRDSSPSPSLTVSDTDASVDSGLSMSYCNFHLLCFDDIVYMFSFWRELF